MDTMQLLDREQMRTDIPQFKAGDTVKVHVRIREGDKERIQVFQGVVIRKRKGRINSTLSIIGEWRGKIRSTPIP